MDSNTGANGAAGQAGSVRAAFIAVTTLFFAWGLITSLIDPLVAAVKGIFTLTDVEAQLSAFAFFIAYGLISFPAATLIARVRPVPAILMALATMVAACLVMLLAGLYAIIWPLEALAVLLLLGGVLLLIDGALGLWSLTFGGGKSGNYWFDVVANAVSLILGIVILISPLLATVFTVTVISTLIGLAAVVVGVMEIVVVVRERESYARIWPVVLSGVSYVLLGLVFLIFPLLSASVGVILGGMVLVVFAIGLFGWAWRLYKASKA